MEANRFIEVEDLNKVRYLLYSVDVCCGKALLIRKEDHKFCVKPLTDLTALID